MVLKKDLLDVLLQVGPCPEVDDGHCHDLGAVQHGLVGLRSARYEFRTERHVQEVLAKECGDVELIDEAGCLPCAGLNRVPPHQVPDLLSLNYAQDAAMAEACRKLGIEVLLSGGGARLRRVGRAGRETAEHDAQRHEPCGPQSPRPFATVVTHAYSCQ